MKHIAFWSYLSLALLAIGTDNPARAATVPVSISGFKFVPSAVTVQAGDTVTWTQKDTTAHTSTSDTGLWDSPFLSFNQTFSRTFDTAGSFPYHCTPHASTMKASVTVQGAPANQPPVVTLTSPSNGATLTDGNVTLEASASDPDGSIAKVQFFDGRTALGEATSSPFRLTVSLPEGTHNFQAQATDNKGAVGSSAVVSITITLPAANKAPTVTLSSPSDGATFPAPASVQLEAQAADADGSVSKVEFFVGDALVGTATSSPFKATWNQPDAGNFTLTAKATDNLGASTVSAPVHIQVAAATGDIMLSDPAKSADGSKFQFILHGVSGRTYLVQNSADMKTWGLVKTVVASSDHFAVTDLPLGDLGHSFFRVQAQP